MRILFLHHAPLDESAVGRLTARWQSSLAAGGHQARILLVDEKRQEETEKNLDRVVSRAGDLAADLPFELPRFAGEAPGRTTFGQLTDEQLEHYRDRLRKRLDEHVDQFDPHVIHAQYIGVWGQLAVETGVPYVASVWGPELAADAFDARYVPLAEQAAANAGRILAPDATTLGQLRDRFEFDSERGLVGPDELGMRFPPESPAERAADALVPIYESLLDEMFGRVP